MHCCSNCFLDHILKKIIDSNAKNRGNCDFCALKEVPVISCEEIAVHFETLFDQYTNYEHAERSLKLYEPVLLYKHLYLYWPGLFNMKQLNAEQIKALVANIATHSENFNPKLFAEPVELTSLLDDNLLATIDGTELKWNNFARELRYNNRFFLTEVIDTDLLSFMFENLRSIYDPGTVFYRARLSDHLLSADEMNKPPVHLTRAGRANPVGIPYLYLSNDLRTTLFETRISLHETLTIGKFKLNEHLSLVSLKNIKQMGPFEIQERGFELGEFIVNRPYLQKLETELSKPVRKQDVDLDYLPTQYLCEFIKSLGFDAVEYKSAMNPAGFNLAVFNDKKLKCEEVKFYNVNRVEYDWTEM